MMQTKLKVFRANICFSENSSHLCSTSSTSMKSTSASTLYGLPSAPLRHFQLHHFFRACRVYSNCVCQVLISAPRLHRHSISLHHLSRVWPYIMNPYHFLGFQQHNCFRETKGLLKGGLQCPLQRLESRYVCVYVRLSVLLNCVFFAESAA